MAHHDVNCFTKNFKAIKAKIKTNDIRYNDRGYQMNDTVTLHDGQYENGEFVRTGGTESARISHIDDYGCQPGYLNLSFSDVGMLIVKDDKE